MNKPLLFLMSTSLFGLVVLILFAQPKLEGSVSLPSLIPREPLTILAVGDINLGRQNGERIDRGEILYPFQQSLELIRGADIAFGNLESQLRDTKVFQDPQSEYRFSGPLKGARSLKEAGFDIISVANNHMWDYGWAGLESTIGALRGVALPYAGAAIEKEQRFFPVVIEQKGWRVGFFALTDFINGYEKIGAADCIAHLNDLGQILESIAQAKNTLDLVIVSFHNGTEYSATPLPRSKKVARQLIDAGADVVLGHHPHVVQRVEEYLSNSGQPDFAKASPGEQVARKGIIFYSLGNFAFWQPFTFWTKHGLAVELTLNEPHKPSYKLIPIRAGWQPALLEDEGDKETLLKRVMPEATPR